MQVSVFTSDIKGGQCDSHVTVVVYGEKGCTGQRALNGRFERGAVSLSHYHLYLLACSSGFLDLYAFLWMCVGQQPIAQSAAGKSCDAFRRCRWRFHDSDMKLL